MCGRARCVIVGGAPVNRYDTVRGYIGKDDFVIYCDSGLKHLKGLGAAPSLIIGDWDSYEDPHMDVETITLPVAKDDTDTVYAMHEGVKRGFRDFLLIGVIGARLDQLHITEERLTAESMELTTAHSSLQAEADVDFSFADSIQQHFSQNNESSICLEFD